MEILENNKTPFKASLHLHDKKLMDANKNYFKLRGIVTKLNNIH